MYTDIERYEELEATYKIRHNTHGLLTVSEKQMLSPAALLRATTKAMEPYDVVVEPCGYGLLNSKFRVLKNGPKLAEEDLALICGRGEICYGYSCDTNVISIYTKEVWNESKEIPRTAT